MASRKSRSRPPMGSRWLPGMRRRGTTSRPSFISTATEQTPPIARPKSKRSGRAASAFSISTTAAMADQVEGLRKRDNVADAIAAYDHLIGLGVPAGKIVAYGESLGSGQAVRLAAARPVAAVVLEAPLTSTVDVARSTYFWLPLGLLITDKYNNERNIRFVTAPVLILHGEQDAVIPVEMGWRVYRAANEPKRIELFPQGTHDDLFDQGAWEKTQAFVDSLSGSTRKRKVTDGRERWSKLLQ